VGVVGFGTVGTCARTPAADRTTNPSSPAQAQEKFVLLCKKFDKVKVFQLAENAYSEKKDDALIDARIGLQGS
jgi:hypothetical protein